MTSKQTITKRLKELAEKEYAEFEAKLTPTVDPKACLGVRVPKVRSLAKQIYKEGDFYSFLNELPHKFLDENLLHGLILSEFKDYDQCIEYLEKFLPYIDNWIVCDTLSPKCFSKNKKQLINKIKEWSKSKEVYTSRFGIEMLMSHFLDKDFKSDYLKIPAKVHIDDYYSKMMVAWFYATALAKQWDDTISYIENKKLDEWTHNKTIQKAKESFRITDKQKEYLKTFKI